MLPIRKSVGIKEDQELSIFSLFLKLNWRLGRHSQTQQLFQLIMLLCKLSSLSHFSMDFGGFDSFKICVIIHRLISRIQGRACHFCRNISYAWTWKNINISASFAKKRTCEVPHRTKRNRICYKISPGKKSFWSIISLIFVPEKFFCTFSNPHSSLLPLNSSTFTYLRHRKEKRSFQGSFLN